MRWFAGATGNRERRDDNRPTWHRLTCQFLLCLLAGGSITGQERDREILANYVNRDVREMPDVERAEFTRAFRSLSGDGRALRKDDWEFVPYKLYKFKSPAYRCFIEIAPGFERPGFCGLRVHSFGADWSYLKRDTFSTGYRQEIKEVRLLHRAALDADLLVVKSASAGPWTLDKEGRRVDTPFFSGDFQLQYYAPVDGKLMLVRRENGDGDLVLNHYANWTVPEIGKHFPRGTTDELVEILESGPVIKQLALLSWLTGTHLSSSEPRRKGVSQEPLASSTAWESLRHDRRLGPIIDQLRSSESAWVREYADQL